jgi:SAM-dependent methyltransferase
MTTTTAISNLKDKHRHLWAAGDYAQSARYIGPVGPDLVRRLAIAAGDRVLDVATGTGLAAIPAAQAGATVTGLDLTPELLDVARERAAAQDLEVTWIEGDAEALPFDDASFDVVLSTFGIQFAPRHGHCAAEIARVCAPGGTLGLCNWTPASFIGNVLKTVGGYMPAPPAGASPPPAWGDRAHVEELLGEAFELSFDSATADFTGDSAEQFVDFFASWYGPLITARTALDAQGRWAALRAELIELATTFDAGDDGFRAPSEYLVVTGRRRS